MKQCTCADIRFPSLSCPLHKDRAAKEHLHDNDIESCAKDFIKLCANTDSTKEWSFIEISKRLGYSTEIIEKALDYIADTNNKKIVAKWFKSAQRN